MPEGEVLGDLDLAGVGADDLDVSYMSVHDQGLHFARDRIAAGAMLQSPGIDVTATQGRHSPPAGEYHRG